MAAALVWIVLVAAAASSAAAEQTAEATPIPSGLLLYKYAPGAVGDDHLLQMVKQQIGQDQWAYKHPESAGDHVFVFTKEQVAGRTLDFAAKELLPAYRKYLTDLATQIPGRLSFTSTRSLGFLEHHDGALRTKSESYLSREYKLQPHERRDLPTPLQGWEILGTFPGISAPGANLRLTDITRSFQARGRRVLLALDHDPEVPPIALKSPDAERLWKRPECSPLASHYQRKGMTKAAADAAAADCRDRQIRYGSSPAVRSVFDIEIDRVTVTDRAWIVQARLVGARVYGPNRELLETLAAADFVSVGEKMAAVQREDAKAAGQQRSKIAELARMEVLGVRLGMPVREAESVLRAGQKIQSVYRFSAPPVRQAGPSAPRANPYGSGLLFVANGGKDVVVLFAANDAVVGVTRRMLAGDGVTTEVVTEALTDKYGRPARTDRRGAIWGQSGKGCAGEGAIDPRSAMQLLEGEPVMHVTYKAVGISVRHEATVDVLAGCHTVLQMGANIAGTAKPHVDFRLFDHSAVAGALKKIEEQKKPRPGEAREKLKL